MNLRERIFKPSGNSIYSARRIFLPVLITTAILLCGCEQNQTQKLQEENDILRRQIESMSTVTPEAKLEAMSVLKKIKIRSRSGFYDRDKDGKKEVLKVYVQPIDSDGDNVKAPGSVRVQLWDINGETDSALLKTWQVGPQQLKQFWAETFLTRYYRLTFDVKDMAEDQDKELKLKVIFTDYVTGKVFEEHIMIKP